MIITKDAYLRLLLLPSVPPETGGLLGSHHGIIDTICIDRSCAFKEKAVYVPNVQYLNRQLLNWQKCGINFEGIFHSHPTNSPELSQDDKAYIQTIMQAMPLHFNKLYFPVILPGEKITSFWADRRSGNLVSVVRDNIKIIKYGGEDHDERNQKSGTY